jgi:hypothetical protein
VWNRQINHTMSAYSKFVFVERVVAVVVVEYKIRGDFWLRLVLFLLSSIIILFIKACISLSLVQVSKHYLSYIYIFNEMEL